MLPINEISSFSGEYHWLSNFYVHPKDKSCVEVEYQKSKVHPKYWDLFKGITPAKAKILGNKFPLNWENWSTKRLEVMKSLVKDKFMTHPDLAMKLLGTGDAYLVEGNNWGDKFWGQVDGYGENHLGKILMVVREQIKQNS